MLQHCEKETLSCDCASFVNGVYSRHVSPFIILNLLYSVCSFCSVHACMYCKLSMRPVRVVALYNIKDVRFIVKQCGYIRQSSLQPLLIEFCCFLKVKVQWAYIYYNFKSQFQSLKDFKLLSHKAECKFILKHLYRNLSERLLVLDTGRQYCFDNLFVKDYNDS